MKRLVKSAPLSVDAVSRHGQLPRLLATAHGVNQFELVALSQRLIAMPTFRYDLSVKFDRYPLVFVTQLN